MEEWKEYRLDAICRLSAGGDAPHNAVKKPTADMTVPIYSNGENEKGLYGYTDSHKIEAPAVTISARGNIGYVCYRKENFVPIVRLITAKANEQILSNEFLYYCLCNTHIWGDGSVQKQLTVPMISEYIVRIPPLNIQSKIVHVLKSLDDKIEVNRRINDNLEQQAQALFKSWFVDFEPFKDGEFVESELGMIPKGWRVGKLGELCQFKRGKNLLSKNAIPGGVPVVAGGLEPSCYHNVSNTKSPVITVSGSGANAGFMRMYYQKVWASDCSFIDSTCENLYFVYCFLSVNRRLLKHAQTGAVQPHVKPADIHDFDIVIPPQEDIIKFQEVVAGTFSMRGVCEQESHRLAEMRDTLLPRLMSGELKVKDIEL